MLTKGLTMTETCAVSLPCPHCPRRIPEPGSKWREGPRVRPGSTLLSILRPSVPVHRSGYRREPGSGDCSPSPAFQDRDFLENEQFFLETLKKASYNMTSHSA